MEGSKNFLAVIPGCHCGEYIDCFLILTHLIENLAVKLMGNILSFYLIIDPIVILRNADARQEHMKAQRKFQMLLR